MDVTQVIQYVMTCNPMELSTINDAISDRLDELFSTGAESAQVEAGTPAEEEAVLPPQSF